MGNLCISLVWLFIRFSQCLYCGLFFIDKRRATNRVRLRLLPDDARADGAGGRRLRQGGARGRQPAGEDRLRQGHPVPPRTRLQVRV
jgi:hypothetical protein